MPLTPPSPPQLPDLSQFFSVGNYLNFWNTQTYGLFIYVVVGLLGFSIYAKTKSITLTAVVLLITAVGLDVAQWLIIFVVPALAYLLYSVFYKRKPFE